MGWNPDVITPGEIDALQKAAERSWTDDTRYPLWRGSSSMGGGQCFVTASWLVHRLGGYVGRREGHYAWVSPDGSFALDLTGNHSGGYYYGPNPGYEQIPAASSEPGLRAGRFARRADRIFDGLAALLLKQADLAGADPYPAEEPQRSTEIDQYYHDEPNADPSQGEYAFVYANGQLEISPRSHFTHDDLAGHLGVSDSHQGPLATGHVLVNNGSATWQAHSNVNAKALFRIFKDYSKQAGWKWGGLTNIEGEPISDEFAPKRTNVLRFAYAGDHLILGRVSHSELLLRVAAQSADEPDPALGTIRVTEGRATVFPVHVAAIPALCEWATDQGLTLYAGNDNVLKTIPDLQEHNLGDPDADEGQNPLEPQQRDERLPSGLYRCPACDRLFPSWGTYQRHRKDGHDWAGDGGQNPEDSGFPEVNMDATFPTHFTEQQPMVMPVASVKEAQRVAGFKGGTDEDLYYVAYEYGQPIGYARICEGKIVDIHTVRDPEVVHGAIYERIERHSAKEPKDLLAGSLPFIYDVQNDTIDVGDPGQRTADIPGRFTPGGIVEGTYEPGGKVLIRSMTNMPYTVRHMVDLWYWKVPHLEVKSVHLQDDSGSDTKLANNYLGQTVRTLAAADPTVHAAATALQQAGGHVYAVGGAVRDAILGNEPKDIDLMVTGLPAESVQAALRALPGRMDYTGKDFGVFRYRSNGAEVEVALPRRERSTGQGHTDFDVQADHTMKPEEDLYRRDFTANALAVDLSDGSVIDPFGGADDIGHGVLRTIHDKSLAEDPLRVVRALVAHARHGLEPDEATRIQMQANAKGLQNLPPERIQTELDKLLAAKDPAKGIRLAQATGVLGEFLPEVANAFGFNQNNPHHELELGDHLLNVLDRVAQKTGDPDLRLAGLLHDIGKPASAWEDPVTGKNHFYRGPNGEGANHEDVGADMAREALSRLRYPKDRINRVVDLVQHHMWKAFTTPKGARKFLNRVGPHADDLLTLRWADQGGKTEYPTDPTLSLDTQRNYIEQVRNEKQPTDVSHLAIRGGDLIAAGIPQGLEIGRILGLLTEAVLEDPALNNPDSLLNLARQYVTM